MEGLSNTEADDAVDAFQKGYQNLDADAAGGSFADDIVIWHSSTNNIRNKEDTISFFRKFFQLFSKLEFVDIRRFQIEDGLIEQHRVRGTFKDGSQMPDIHKCFIVKVREDKIYSIEDYFDASALSSIGARIAALPE